MTDDLCSAVWQWWDGCMAIEPLGSCIFKPCQTASAVVRWAQLCVVLGSLLGSSTVACWAGEHLRLDSGTTFCWGVHALFIHCSVWSSAFLDGPELYTAPWVRSFRAAEVAIRAYHRLPNALIIPVSLFIDSRCATGRWALPPGV